MLKKSQEYNLDWENETHTNAPLKKMITTHLPCSQGNNMFMKLPRVELSSWESLKWPCYSVLKVAHTAECKTLQKSTLRSFHLLAFIQSGVVEWDTFALLLVKRGQRNMQLCYPLLFPLLRSRLHTVLILNPRIKHYEEIIPLWLFNIGKGGETSKKIFKKRFPQTLLAGEPQNSIKKELSNYLKYEEK